MTRPLGAVLGLALVVLAARDAEWREEGSAKTLVFVHERSTNNFTC